MSEEDISLKIGTVLDICEHCLDGGRFTFKRIRDHLDEIIELGVTVKDLNPYDEEDLRNEVVEALDHVLDELSIFMQLHCEDLKGLKEEPNDYVEIAETAMTLLKTMIDSLYTPGEVNEEFQAACEKASPFDLGMKLLDLLENDSENPLKPGFIDESDMSMDVMMWEDIIDGFLSQLLFLESYANGLIGDGKGDKAIELNEIFEGFFMNLYGDEWNREEGEEQNEGGEDEQEEEHEEQHEDEEQGEHHEEEHGEDDEQEQDEEQEEEGDQEEKQHEEEQEEEDQEHDEHQDQEEHYEENEEDHQEEEDQEHDQEEQENENQEEENEDHQEQEDHHEEDQEGDQEEEHQDEEQEEQEHEQDQEHYEEENEENEEQGDEEEHQEEEEHNENEGDQEEEGQEKNHEEDYENQENDYQEDEEHHDEQEEQEEEHHEEEYQKDEHEEQEHYEDDQENEEHQEEDQEHHEQDEEYHEEEHQEEQEEQDHEQEQQEEHHEEDYQGEEHGQEEYDEHEQNEKSDEYHEEEHQEDDHHEEDQEHHEQENHEEYQEEQEHEEQQEYQQDEQEHHEEQYQQEEQEEYLDKKQEFQLESIRPIVEEIQDNNSRKSCNDKATMIKDAIEKLENTGDDLFYILVFPSSDAYFGHFVLQDQVLISANRAGCHVVVYRSREAKNASREDLKKMETQVEQCKRKIYKLEMYDPQSIVAEWANESIVSHGFVMGIKASRDASVRSTRTDVLEWGPGWWVHDTLGLFFKQKYIVVAGFK